MYQRVLSALLLCGAAAQASLGVNETNHESSIQELPVDREMTAFVKKVLAMTGLHNDVPVVIDPEATGCAYATTRRGRQYVGVDPQCVGPLRIAGKYNVLAVASLTHEIGHLLGGHTTNATNSHREETEADEWSGWAMRRLGFGLVEALRRAQRYSRSGSRSHPARAIRVASVMRGWNRANEALGSPALVAVVVPTSVSTSVPVPAPEPLRDKKTPASWTEFLRSPLPWTRSE